MIVGQRVRLVRDVEIFPLNIYRTGATGTVVATSINSVVIAEVRLDEHYPELDEWDNELQVCDPTRDDAGDCTPDAWEVV